MEKGETICRLIHLLHNSNKLFSFLMNVNEFFHISQRSTLLCMDFNNFYYPQSCHMPLFKWLGVTSNIHENESVILWRQKNDLWRRCHVWALPFFFLKYSEKLILSNWKQIASSKNTHCVNILKDNNNICTYCLQPINLVFNSYHS